MGQSISVDLAYGVNIGYDDDGWNFDGWPDVHEHLGFDEEETEGEWLEMALLTFLGHENVLDMGYRESKAAIEECPLSIVHYGYQSGGLLLTIGSSSVSGIFSVQSIDLPEHPSVEDARVLVDFLAWLEARGLVLKDKARNPGWILAGSYG